MSSEPITIGYGANKWVKDATNRVVCLYNFWMGTGVWSMAESGTTNWYQVPVGKKLICLFARTSYSSVDFNTSNTVNSNGQMILSCGSGSGSAANNQNVQWDMYCEVPAGKYINVGYLSNSAQKCTLFGVEVDA